MCFSIYLSISVHISVYLCYISAYSHLSSKDVPRDLLQNERLESFWGGLWLGIQPFLFLKQNQKNQCIFNEKYKNIQKIHSAIPCKAFRSEPCFVHFVYKSMEKAPKPNRRKAFRSGRVALFG